MEIKEIKNNKTQNKNGKEHRAKRKVETQKERRMETKEKK